MITALDLSTLEAHLWESASILHGPVDAAEFSALAQLWEALSPDPVLAPYTADYRWLTQVYESVKPPSGHGKLLWHALGHINFLFDRSQTPHTTPGELCARFGVAQSTASNKAKQIRDLFNMSYFDVQRSRPSKIDENPVAWMVTVNGLIMDVRTLPPEIQEEAYRKGLIPR